MRYIIANWKQNKTFKEYEMWRNAFFSTSLDVPEDWRIIIAPSALFISDLSNYIKELGINNILVASQDISHYENGAHTGLIGAEQFFGLITHTIIGHAERRKDGDSNDNINKKIEHAFEYGITPIVCFSDVKQLNAVRDYFGEKELWANNMMFAYEPINAIGTGKPMSPDLIDQFADSFNLEGLIYGGSVDVDNISNYLKLTTVKGILVGSASLNSEQFRLLIDEALSS